MYSTDQARIDRNWRAVTIELDAPRPGRFEQLLRMVGLPAHLTRLVVATPALRRAWFVATGGVMVLGLTADGQADRAGLLPLLLLAPLVPVLGVSMAYGVEADPAHEASLATPLSGLRLVLTRAATVLGFSVVLLGLVSLVAANQAVSTMAAFGWLLPAFGTTGATLALMTVLAPRRAAVVAGVAWVVLVLIARGAADDPLAAFDVGGQVTMSVVAAVGVFMAYVRRDRFDLLGATA